MLRRRFHAMGTDCELFLKARPRPEALRAMAEAEWEVRRLESIFSRFDPDSELSELNRRGTLRVGPELLEVVDLALAARHRTGGRFDPTVHDALVAAGYDRTFEEVASAEARGGSPRAFGGCSLRGVGPCGSQDADDRARSRGPPRSRRDRQGLRGGSRREDPRGARPVPGRRRRRHRRPWRRMADRARHRRRHAHARARRRCGRDLRPRPSPLDAGPSGAAPHHPARHRLAGDERPASGDRHRGDRDGSGGASESPLPRRRGGGRTRGEARPRNTPPCSSRSTAGRASREGLA